MSDFKVPYTKILNITPHNNAERLAIAWVYGFQVVVQKDRYKVGDEIIYVPIDSILPSKLENILFPKDSKVKLNSSRIRQIRLRGFPSQGLIVNPKDVSSIANPKYFTPEQDLASILGITKYEPPVAGPSSTMGQGKNRNRKYEHPLFHKYNGLESIKWHPDLFKEGEEVALQEKLHGCVQSKTKIRLSDGNSKTIKEIVDNKLDVKVLGVDKNGNVVESKILNHFNNGKTRDWYRIKVSRKKAGGGKNVRSLNCTGNHKFFDPETNEYISADKLKIGQQVYLLREDLDISFLQKEILIGKMLGDGHLENNSIGLNQSKAQEEYLLYTLKMLGNIAGNRTNNVISGYGTEMCRARTVSRDEIAGLFENWFKNGKKDPPKNLKLTPISLAFWYMDDGCLQHNKAQEDRACFATCAFSDEGCQNLIKSFNNMGIKAKSFSALSAFKKMRL